MRLQWQMFILASMSLNVSDKKIKNLKILSFEHKANTKKLLKIQEMEKKKILIITDMIYYIHNNVAIKWYFNK